jgi:hypothetical protein
VTPGVTFLSLPSPGPKTATTDCRSQALTASQVAVFGHVGVPIFASVKGDTLDTREGLQVRVCEGRVIDVEGRL